MSSSSTGKDERRHHAIERVKQSGGHIRARSAPGRGTSLEVYLPVRDEDPEASKVLDSVH
jgi:hypothetical protein